MKKNLIVLILTVLGGASSLFAQQATATAGGEATGVEGTVSYTVGQVVYTSKTGSNGSITQGVQQPYEISVVTGILEAQGISLETSIYPNPTTDYLTVRIENYETDNLQFMVFDINGKLLKTVKATGNQTEILTSEFVPSSYFIKVIDGKKEIKTFKIVKN